MFEKEVAAIIEILNKELGYYSDLTALAKTKREVIVAGKVAELDKIVKLEQNMIFDIGQLEKKREDEVSRLCIRFGVNGQAVTLSQLTQRLSKEERRVMDVLQQRLKHVLAELKAANDLNGELIKQSLEYIDFSINMITSAGMSTSSLYEEMNGKEKTTAEKKRFFDTKV